MEALKSQGLEHVAGIVHKRVASVEKEQLCLIVYFEWEKGEEQEQNEQSFTMYGQELTCISLEHMIIPGGCKGRSTCELLMYEAMFRKGEKPVPMSYHVGNVEGKSLITVMPSPEGGLGRIVTVILPEEAVKDDDS